ncbi:MAG: 50S ribosomal protein L24 [Halobacteriaceae archaeon]
MTRQPRKQRTRQREASLHERHKQVRAHLSEELRAEHGVRRVRVNEGDTVEVLRGDFAGEEGDVTAVDLKQTAVYVEDVTVEKADGEEVQRGLDASNLQVVDLNLSDDRRAERLAERGESE